MNSLEVKAIDEAYRNHRLEVSTHTSGNARVVNSLDSGIGEASGKYCLEVITHPSGKALGLTRSDGMIIWALALAWADGNIVGAQEQESALSDDIGSQGS